MQVDDSIDTIAQKALEPGKVLKLDTWISDISYPGQRVYQMMLEGGLSTSGTEFATMAEEEARKQFDSITSVKQFYKMIGMPAQF
ncbi:MAG: hypothetical protein ABIH34_06710 [Nanoarchaeota archaeon]